MLQFIVVNLYTKFEVSILNGGGDNFDDKSGEKEKGTNTRKNKQEKGPFAILQYNLSLQASLPNLKFLSYTVVEISFTKYLERKKKGQTQIGECPFAIPRYNLSL